jgi:CMP-N-acetylneuraminic acid synthetase
MNIKKQITAILPMRAGSQRVKGKNERIINGKYLYEYIVDTLLHAKLVGNIIINTDIKNVTEKYYANSQIKIVKRPNHLKGNINMNLVIDQTLDHTEDEYFVQVHATNPLLKATTIDRAIDLFIKNQKNNDSLFSVTKVQKRFWRKNGLPINHKIGDEPTTQNLEPYFEENSCLYIFSRESFNKNNNRIGKNPILFEISKIESWDIDEEEDLKIAKDILISKSAG